MSTESPLHTARHFAEINTATLSENLLAWRKTGQVPEGCVFHHLAKLCIPISGNGDEYQEAEQLVIQAAVRQASYVDALHAALSKCVSRGLNITLTEDELEGYDDLLGQRQPAPSVDVASTQNRVSALIAKIEDTLRNGNMSPGEGAGHLAR
jgi:hypothetical protein